MYFLVLGLVMVLLKYLAIGPVAQLAWWWVLLPFGLAAAWWSWADSTGYTKRKAVQREDQRKKDRIARQRASLGISGRSKENAVKLSDKE